MKILLKILPSLLLVPVSTGGFSSFFSSINSSFISGIKPKRTGHLSIQKNVRRYLQQTISRHLSFLCPKHI